MTHFSPTAILSWAVFSCILEAFLLWHLYHFDRFHCLKWNSKSTPGTFKRIMTYTYLSTIPLIIFFSVVLSIIKYREGFIDLPPHGIIPKPYDLWAQSHKGWVVPLYYIFAFAWALEVITHLEELTFWLFMLGQGTTPVAWFDSIQFKFWCAGSILAIVTMPIVVGQTRSNPAKCEAWIFFAGSIGSGAITMASLYVLLKFPKFLRRVASDGADWLVLNRLRGFHKLNVVRVVFRFIFITPLFIMSIDGIGNNHRHPVNESLLATDLLVITAGLGCIVSSGITLLIFFPVPERDLASSPAAGSQKDTGIPLHHTSGETSRYSQREWYSGGDYGEEYYEYYGQGTKQSRTDTMDTRSSELDEEDEDGMESMSGDDESRYGPGAAESGAPRPKPSRRSTAQSAQSPTGPPSASPFIPSRRASMQQDPPAPGHLQAAVTSAASPTDDSPGPSSTRPAITKIRSHSYPDPVPNPRRYSHPISRNLRADVEEHRLQRLSEGSTLQGDSRPGTSTVKSAVGGRRSGEGAVSGERIAEGDEGEQNAADPRRQESRQVTLVEPQPQAQAIRELRQRQRQDRGNSLSTNPYIMNFTSPIDFTFSTQTDPGFIPSQHIDEGSRV